MWDPGGTLRATLRMSRVQAYSSAFAHPLVADDSTNFDATMSADGRVVAAVERSEDGGQGTLRIYDLQSNKEVESMSGEIAAESQSGFSPDGRILVARFADEMRLWDAKERREVEIPVRSGANLVFSRDGATVTTVEPFAEQAQVWDMGDGHLRGALNGHSNAVDRVEYGDDHTIRTYGADGTLRIYAVPR